MPIFGWDASDFDWDRGPMDLGAAYRDGISFFTHKATEGTKVIHRYYGAALNRARAAGFELIGAYIVPRTPGNNGHGSVQDQVSFFLNYLDSQTPWWRSWEGFFLQVDTEHWGYDDVPADIGAAICAELGRRVDKFRVHYAPRWAYGDTITGNDPLWASSYGTNPAVPYRNAYPGDGSSGWAPYSGRVPTILQYGSRLTIGSQPTCDGNAFRGTVEQLRALITGRTDMELSGDSQRRVVNLEEREHQKNAGDPDKLRYILPAGQIGGPNDVGNGYGETPNRDKIRHTEVLGALTALGQSIAGVQVAGQPTDAQVDAGILKAMQDPAVQKGIGDAIAQHLHVT